ncbi:hypothetical protein O9992_12370 [Vibrio lentus]|nr:hypothetical protein [Vibrio lentus]
MTAMGAISSMLIKLVFDWLLLITAANLVSLKARLAGKKQTQEVK